MRVMDFEHLSKLDKTVLRKIPTVGRITHHGKWQEKVEKLLQEEVTETSKKEINTLIKKLKKES
jgi:hypothetical protein